MFFSEISASNQRSILKGDYKLNNSTVTTTASVPCLAQQSNSLNSTQSPPSEVQNSSNKQSSTSFALQTSSSRISTLDMLPQLLQAELDLAEVARSLQTPPATFQSPNCEKSDDLCSERTSPSPHRLSHLIASLEAAQEHLANDVIDLTTIPPPQLQTKNEANLPLAEETVLRSKDKKHLTHAAPHKEEQQRKSLDTSRVVAELDHLCDTLLEMKCTSSNELHNQQQFSNTTKKLKEDNKEQLQAQKERQHFDESLQMTFDQLTASINKLILEGTESTVVAGEENSKESIAGMVIPPLPPDSPTQIKEQDEIIKRFWEATEDVKTMIAFRKRKQQQQQLAYLQQAQFQDEQFQQMQQNFLNQTPMHLKKTIHKNIATVPVTSGQISSDSTAVNTSSDSESDVTPGNNNVGYQQLPEKNIPKQRQYLQEGTRQRQHQQNPYFANTVQHICATNDHPNHQSHSLRHHQHQSPIQAPRSASAESVQYLQSTGLPSYVLLQQPTSESDHFSQMMMANQINNFDNTFLMNNQVLLNLLSYYGVIF